VTPPLLLGADFGRPAGDVATLHYYTSLDWAVDGVQIHPPVGWVVADNDLNVATVGRMAIGRATLVAQGTHMTPGSVVTISARHGATTQTRELSVSSDAVTAWSLLGPIPVPEGDALEALPHLDEDVLNGRPNMPVEWRLHRGLQCSGYVNLTAFLENVYGPVPSGDYKVYRMIAYAATSIHSTVARAAHLELTGEDRFRVWFNGRECLRTTSRQATAALVVIELQKGWNQIVIKSSQDATREWGGRRWGMECRLRDPGGRVLQDLLIDPMRGPSDQ
jgi:hypothetical protein